MDESHLRALVDGLRSGEIEADTAVAELKRLPYADLGFAKIDHHRALRQSMPEAIYGPGKDPAHCSAIVAELLANGTGPVMLTRASAEQTELLDHDHPGATKVGGTLVWRAADPRQGNVTILTAGTSDLPVAYECQATLHAQGFEAQLVPDCGVAGVHRLLSVLDTLDDIDVLVVVAGMEGALASIAGGITAAPVVAIPTSVGYGSAFQGITAMLAMLSSCASGITVVGIDNGFGAACATTRILNSKGY